MTGSIQHIRDDRYRVVVYAGINPRTRKSRYISEAFRCDGGPQKATKVGGAVVEKLQAQIKAGRIERGYVSGAVSTWLDEREPDSSPTTMTNYRRIGRAIIDEFGRMPIGELRSSDVRAWYARLRKDGMSAANLRHYHSVLRAVCRQAVADDLMLKPATQGVRLPPAEDKPVDVPTDRAMMAILSHARGDLAVALWLSAATGMRRGEVLALRWSDLRGTEMRVARALVEVQGDVLTKTPKGRRSREVELDHQTMRLLARHRIAQVANAGQFGVELAKRADRHVLANLEVDPTAQTPYPPTWLSHGWAVVRKKANAEHVTLHQIRHWHATSLLDSGMVTMADLAARLGHADPSVTARIYTHSRKGRGRIAANVIGQNMKALPSGPSQPHWES